MHVCMSVCVQNTKELEEKSDKSNHHCGLGDGGNAGRRRRRFFVLGANASCRFSVSLLVAALQLLVVSEPGCRDIEGVSVLLELILLAVIEQGANDTVILDIGGTSSVAEIMLIEDGVSIALGSIEVVVLGDIGVLEGFSETAEVQDLEELEFTLNHFVAAATLSRIVLVVVMVNVLSILGLDQVVAGKVAVHQLKLVVVLVPERIGGGDVNIAKEDLLFVDSDLIAARKLGRSEVLDRVTVDDAGVLHLPQVWPAGKCRNTSGNGKEKEQLGNRHRFSC